MSKGEDPEGVYLTAIVDTDDLTAVLEAVGGRVVDMQVDDGLLIDPKMLATVSTELKTQTQSLRICAICGFVTRPLPLPIPQRVLGDQDAV